MLRISDVDSLLTFPSNPKQWLLHSILKWRCCRTMRYIACCKECINANYIHKIRLKCVQRYKVGVPSTNYFLYFGPITLLAARNGYIYNILTFLSFGSFNLKVFYHPRKIFVTCQKKQFTAGKNGSAVEHEKRDKHNSLAWECPRDSNPGL